MSVLAEYHQNHKRFHAEIARRASMVQQREDRTYSIPNTPYGVRKTNPPTPNIEPYYWHTMWFHDLVFGTSPGGGKKEPTVDEIMRAVAREFGVSKLDILSDRRSVNVVRPRQVVAYLAKKCTTKSYPEIGRRIGGRDHTTAISSVKRIEKIIALDQEFAARVAKLAASFGGLIE